MPFLSSKFWIGLFALLTFGPGLGGFPSNQDQDEKSKKAIEAIKKLGSRVQFTKNGLDVKLVGKKAIQCLVYLKELPNLTSLHLYCGPIKDNYLEDLKDLTSLQFLSLSLTFITDDGLTHLKGLKNLEELDLSGTRVTGKGMATVANFPKLQRLTLLGLPNREQVGDDGLVHLKKLKNLTTLYAPRSKFTGEGLAILADFPALESLTLRENKLGDAGLAHLPRLKTLRELDLEECGITDQGMPSLGKCRQLEKLYLAKNKITDAGLVQLARLTELKRVDISSTKVSQDGVRMLKKKLTKTRITSNFRD